MIKVSLASYTHKGKEAQSSATHLLGNISLSIIYMFSMGTVLYSTVRCVVFCYCALCVVGCGGVVLCRVQGQCIVLILEIYSFVLLSLA